MKLKKLGLIEIITAALLTLTQASPQSSAQASLQKRNHEYKFRASLLIPLITGNFYYNSSYNDNHIKIKGEIKPLGGLIGEIKEIRHRTYNTIAYEDSIVYTEETDSIESKTKIFYKGSPYFDVLTSAHILLNYIEKDSLEYHKLITEGSLTLFVENKVLSAKLISLEEAIIKYKGNKVKVKKLSIYGCPNDDTFFDFYIYDKKIVKIHGMLKDLLGIRINANLIE